MRQFKGKPHGKFRDDARWSDTHMAVEFTLDVSDDIGTEPIRCRVSTEALDDTTGHKGPHDSQTMLAIYRRLIDRVHVAVDRKLKLAAFEDDGSLLVRRVDLSP